MGGKKGLFILLAFLLLVFSASAQFKIAPVTGLDVQSFAVQNKVEPGEWAEYNVRITNFQSKPDLFFLSIQEEGVEFSSITKPTAHLSSGIRVGPGETTETTYLLKPSADLLPNPEKPYQVELHVRAMESKIKDSTLLQVYLLPEGWRAAQRTDLDIEFIVPELIDPRNVYALRVHIQNKNKRDVGELQLKLRSELIDQVATVTIGPEEGKTAEFSVTFEKDQPPMEDTLILEVRGKGELLYRTSVPMEIVSYRIPFEKQEELDKAFLKYTKTITVTNRENVAEEQTVKIPITTRERLFTSATPEAKAIKEEGQQYLAWNVYLNPDESGMVTMVTSYRVPFFIVVLVTIVLFVLYMMRDPVTLLKESGDIKSFEGGIVELKVALSLKNRTNKEYHGVEVMDKVPSIATYKKGAEIGEMKPNRVIRKKDGIILKWNIGKIEPYEERILTYSLKSKLSILGDFRMPRAMVMLKDEHGTKITVKSNEMDVSSSGQSEEE